MKLLEVKYTIQWTKAKQNCRMLVKLDYDFTLLKSDRIEILSKSEIEVPTQEPYYKNWNFDQHGEFRPVISIAEAIEVYKSLC